MKHVPDYLLPDSVDGEKIKKSQAGPQKVYFKKQRYNPHKRNQVKKKEEKKEKKFFFFYLF